MKFITVDGIDKSGKSSIIKEVFSATNGTVLIMDRSLSSWHFFNEITDRVPEEQKIRYAKEYNAKLKDFRSVVDLSIILTVSEKDWLIRCKEHSEQPLIGDLNFDEHQREIERYFNKAKYKNVLRLNTTELTIEECVNLILKRLGGNYANK